MKSKMYVYMDPSAKLKDIQAACADAAANNCTAVCVPQWFVYSAAEALKGSAVKVATILGLPGGTTSSFAKYAEAKQAVVNGAAIIVLPANMPLCAKSDLNDAKQDLGATMVAIRKGAEAIALLDAAALTEEQLSAAAAMCMQAGVMQVFVANATSETMQKLKDCGIPAGSFCETAVQGSAICAVSKL